MKPLQGRYLTVALASAAAGSLAAGAFGLSSATADHPDPIRLDADRVSQPVAPVPIDDPSDSGDPTTVSPAEVSPITVASAPSLDTPGEPAPPPAVEPRGSDPSAPRAPAASDGSPASVASIDS